MLPGKERAHVGVSEQQATSEKAKILVKPLELWASPEWGYHLSQTCPWLRKTWVRHCGWDHGRGECPEDFGPSSGRGQKSRIVHKATTQHPSRWSLSGGRDNSRQWAEPSAVQLVSTQESWPLTLCTDSQAILNRSTLWLGQWDTKGGWLMTGLYRVRMCGETSGFTSKSLRWSLLSFMSQLIRCWHPWQSRSWCPSLGISPSNWPCDTAGKVHKNSGHHSAQAGWHIAKDTGLPLKYRDWVDAVTACHARSEQHARQLPKESEPIHRSSQQVRGWQLITSATLWVRVLNMPWFVWTPSLV